MRVLVDTPVWSLALRRKSGVLSPTEESCRRRLTSLIADGRVEIVGIVRQEILSGIREGARFQIVRDHLRDFQDEQLTSEDHELAAAMFNQCQKRGVAAPAIDLLLCAVAVRRGWEIFTLDSDFSRYARLLAITLHVL